MGSLKDLPFSDILQILCLSRRSGVLYLGQEDSLAILRFRDGLLHGIDLPGEESPLIRGIRREHLVPDDVLVQAIRECRRATDSLLQILAAKTYLDPEQVRRVVLGEVRAIIRRLLAWKEGEFRFEIAGQEPASLREPRDESRRGRTGSSLEGTLLRIPEGLDPREILLEEMRARGAESVHHFFLPDLPSGPVAQNESAAADGDGIPSGAGSALAVVLVDERAVYRELLGSTWRKEGFRVEAFTSPEAGYQKFALLAEAGASVSLVTDLVVPETGGAGFAGGLELLIRARQEFPGARVLLMSEGVDPTVEEAARSLGVRAILEKPSILPADGDSLRETVEKLARTGARILRDDTAELSVDPEDERSETIHVVDQLSLLGALLGELRRPGSEMEIPLLVLRLASEYFERGILLEVNEQEARGLGGFGGTKGTASSNGKYRRLALPLVPGSRLTEAVSHKTSVRGPLDHPEERHLLEQLGGPSADGVFLPLMSHDQVVAVLYGDNGQSSSPVGDTRGLEIFLGEVGMALERFLHRPPPVEGQERTYA
ncbi:MAG TPA: response regulator [Candidatus Polarisedimenticolia bacterium]|nr:response regulator [Candidatus Polarisedimenticolia bacterium]